MSQESVLQRSNKNTVASRPEKKDRCGENCHAKSPTIEVLVLKNRADGRTTYDNRMAKISFEDVLPRHYTIRTKNREWDTLIWEGHVAEVRCKKAQ